MGLFYVWFKLCAQGNSYQRLITFVNREAADEWWRTISTPPSIHAGRVKCLSPQFYVQINGGENIGYFISIGKSLGTSHFVERMFFADGGHANNSMPNEVTNHISGRWYFIRSKADPFSHWFLRTSGTCAVCGDANCDAIHASSDYRTRFCVRVRNNPEVPADFAMIGKDEISIAAARDYVLHNHDSGDLKATKDYQGEADMLFGDLKNRFITRAEKQVNGEVWEYVESVESGGGEIWELVE